MYRRTNLTCLPLTVGSVDMMGNAGWHSCFIPKYLGREVGSCREMELLLPNPGVAASWKPCDVTGYDVEDA